MGETVRVRSRTAQALGVAMVLLAGAGLVTAALDGGLLRLGAPTVLFGVLGWAAFWRPYVAVSDGGVTVSNTTRTIEVPWPAIESVDGRYGLRLGTAYGRVVAWAASAPAGRQRARGEESETARLVNERRRALQAAGYLDDPKLEKPSPEVTWHNGLLAVLGLLVLASVLLPLLR